MNVLLIHKREFASVLVFTKKVLMYMIESISYLRMLRLNIRKSSQKMMS